MIQLPLVSPAPANPAAPVPRERRRRERRRLVRHSVLAARSAELHRIASLLTDAQQVLGEGWVQHAWFRYRDDTGRARVATAYDLHLMGGRPVIGACLVGAVVQAGGGPSAVHSQLVNRALDLTWHTLQEVGGPVQWCPSPPVRAAHVRELTRWNDAPHRHAGDVTALLHATTRTAAVETGRVHGEQSAL